jgi:hypothetical protein
VQRNLNQNRELRMAVLVVVMMALAVKIAIHHQMWNLRVTVHHAMTNCHQVLPSHARMVMPQVGKTQFNPAGKSI